MYMTVEDKNEEKHLKTEKELPTEVPETPLKDPDKEVPSFPSENIPVEVPDPSVKEYPTDVPNSLPSSKPKEVINPPLEEPLEISPDFKVEPPLEYRTSDVVDPKNEP